MKRLSVIFAILMFVMLTSAVRAESTINGTNKWAWAANSGWLSARPDSTNGVVVGEYTVSGYFWSSSTGWIHMGDGTPTNGIRYTNVSSNDYGVNHDGKGKLSGFAWSPSVGWINFETNGSPYIDFKTGIMHGFAWGGSLGWISFTNTQAFVQTDIVATETDDDKDDIPDAWEYENSGGTSRYSKVSDTDNDGFKDIDEWRARTNPEDIDDYLHISSMQGTNGADTLITWPSAEERLYKIQVNDDLINGTWVDKGGITLPDSGGSSVRLITGTGTTQQFVRVKAVRPPAQ